VVKTFSQLIPRGLVVSCQAPRGEALHGSRFMAHMALAARQGGAVAIRADGGADIGAIRETAGLPVIGLRKNVYPSSPVYITPTIDEAREAVAAGAGVVALDGTARPRPRQVGLGALIDSIHRELNVPVMADVPTLEAGIHAASLGADAIATTLSGYVDQSAATGPDLGLVARLLETVDVPVLAEGRYDTPEQAAAALDLGAYGVVVGTAITRPHRIAERFVAAMEAYLR
jgi:N-acylglucosamine-6-phosphate 2-epimerase